MVRALVGVLAWLALPAWAACQSHSLPVDGTARSAWVCRGEAAAPASGRPLVLAFHGHGSDGQHMAESTQLHRAWPEAMVVYFDGLPGTVTPFDAQGLQTGWAIWPHDMADRDLHLVQAALTQLPRLEPVDASRIYAVGHSNGGRFVGVLWAQWAQPFAALAFSAGQADSLISQAPPRSVFIALGQRDGLVSPTWQRRSIALAAARLALPVPDPQSVPLGLNQACSAPNLCLSTLIHPAGHIWPPGQTEALIAFFKQQRLPTLPLAAAGVEPSSLSSKIK